MSTQLQAMLLDLLVSGFFAVACFKARAAREPGALAMRPRDFLRLTDRIDRLSRTRYQWVAMVAILLLVREQVGVPMTVELTAAAEFVLFLALPVGKTDRALSAKTADDEQASPRRLFGASRSKRARARHERCAALPSARH
jgi:hypothetical protein